jgi:putative acetyltransferase
LQIITAHTAEQYAAAKELFVAYQQFLGEDLCFQSFDAELQQLEQMYGPPSGALLLAVEDDVYGGCIALRSKGHEVCEMKRLYVTDDFKGRGLGRQLAEAIIEKARVLGYKKMVLDTLDRLKPALHLYQTLQFTSTDAYYSNPLTGVVYLQKVL